MHFGEAILYLLAINAITFFIYRWDKRQSRHGGWRVPESTLLGLALIGGTPAAYFAQKKFRHKTSKGNFRARFFAIVLLQCGAAIYLIAR